MRNRLLMQDTKEAAEHATIVDLIRNDLSMVSEHVEVTSYRYIDRLQTNKGPILQTRLRDMRHPARRLHRTPGRHHLPPASCRLHHRRPQAQNRRNHRPGRRLPPGLLHRHHGALCRRTAGQRCHDTLHRAGKRPGSTSRQEAASPPKAGGKANTTK